jgi:2-oxoglutarate ferredoxin oxidoreductase subunit alpha
VGGTLQKGSPELKDPSRVFINGAEAICLAAIHAGCNFFAGYPITPASDILHGMLRLLPPKGGIAIQAEDEIASIGMCIGAAMAGAKTMTATSGPGMSLYSENIGLAIMGEVPLVIVNVQRMGPATGGATAHAEGDVQFVRWITSGGYPLVVYAPTTVYDTYTLTLKAFNTAETLRTPVIILTSKDLVMTHETADLAQFTRLNPLGRKMGDSKSLPYQFTTLDQVPPFLEIGGESPTRFTTSIHDERGIITEDKTKIDRKLRHLQMKIQSRIPEITQVDEDIDPQAHTLIIAYGSCARGAREAIRQARADGKHISLLIIYSLWPIPEEPIQQALKGVRKVIVPELNNGQYLHEIRSLTRDHELISLTRLDGGHITTGEILGCIPI